MKPLLCSLYILFFIGALGAQIINPGGGRERTTSLLRHGDYKLRCER